MNESEICKKYVGVKYKHEGRTIAGGLDCWGLVLSIYEDMGIKLLDISGYDKDWSSKGANYFIENYHTQWEKVEVPKLHDLVFIITHPSKVPNHAGVYLSSGRFIQTCRVGTVITRVSGMKYIGAIEGYYRFKGMPCN